jgi:3-dehydroquinate synthetase
MQHDKKMVGRRLHFVLPTAIGATTIDDVTGRDQGRARQSGIQEEYA